MNQDSGNNRIFNILLLATAILGSLFFCLFKIDKSVWLDEANSILTALKPLDGLIESLKRENNAPGYYLVLHYWMGIFGFSPTSTRLLSAVLYLLSAILVYRIANLVFDDRRTAMFSVVFFIISPIAISQSQNIRMYAMLGFLSALSTHLFLLTHYKTKSISRPRTYLWIAINAFGLFVHYWYLFVIIAQGICFLLFFLRDQRTLYKFILNNFISSIPFTLLWLPAMMGQLKNGANTWMYAPSVLELPATLAKFVGGNVLGYAVILAVIILSIFTWNGGPGIQSKQDIKNAFWSKEQKIFLCLSLSGIIAAWLVSQLQPIFIERYTIVGLPFFAVYLGRLLSSSKVKLLPHAFSIILIIAVVFALGKHRTRTIEKSDKISAETLLEFANKGEAVVFTSLSRPAIEYYLLLNKADKDYSMHSFPAELELHPSWRNIGDMLANKDELILEAEKLSQSLLQNNDKVWVFYGGDPKVDIIVKEELDKKFVLIKSHPIGEKHIFHTGLLEYGRKTN